MFRGLSLRFSEFVPRKLREFHLKKALKYAAVEDDAEEWVGKRLLAAFLAGLACFLFVYVLYRLQGFLYFPNLEFPLSLPLGERPLHFVTPVVPIAAALAAGLAGFFLTLFLYYMHLYYVIEGRAKMVEGVLPDFLLLVSTNINAGMTPFSAFQTAARPEFGPLTEEAKHAISKSMGTSSFTEALSELSARIKSDSLQEAVSFFAQSIRAGGRLSKLLESSAMDIRQTQELKKELQSSTRMYVLFVGFIVMFATPLLLAVSVQFLDMVNAIQSGNHVSFAGETGMGFLTHSSELSGAFMAKVALVLLAGNALLASAFMGVLSAGKAKTGLKYFPAIALVSFLSFVAARAFLKILLPA